MLFLRGKIRNIDTFAYNRLFHSHRSGGNGKSEIMIYFQEMDHVTTVY